MATIILWVKKSISSNTKWIPVTPDNILRSYDTTQLLYARIEHYSPVLLPVIQSLKQTVWSDVRFTNQSSFVPILFSELVEPVHPTVLKCLKQFAARAITQSKLTFRRLTATLTWNEAIHRRIWSCDEWTDSVLQFLQQSLNWGNSSTQTEELQICSCVIIAWLNRWISLAVQMNQFTKKNRISPFAWGSGLQIIMLQIMFSFLHRLIISLHKTSGEIILCCRVYTFFDSQVTVAADLHFMNHQGTQLQLKIFFTVLLKKNVLYSTSWMAWGWVNYQRMLIFGLTIPLNVKHFSINANRPFPLLKTAFILFIQSYEKHAGN